MTEITPQWVSINCVGKDLILSKSEIISAVTYNLVRFTDKDSLLSNAISAFREYIDFIWNRNEFDVISYSILETWLAPHVLIAIREIRKYNEIEEENYIDLHALSRNVLLTIIQQYIINGNVLHAEIKPISDEKSN